MAGLCLLLVSFWAVYERGYVDNDEIAARFEVDPALPAASPASVVTPRWRPWIWAALSGLAALAVLRQQPLPAGPDIARWAGVLAAVAVIYYFYNRFDKPTRVWLFALLQLLRAAAFVVVVPVSVVGAAALAARVLARWVPYEDYRYGSGRWNNGMASLRRLLFLRVLRRACGSAGAARPVGPRRALPGRLPALSGAIGTRRGRQGGAPYRPRRLLTPAEGVSSFLLVLRGRPVRDDFEAETGAVEIAGRRSCFARFEADEWLGREPPQRQIGELEACDPAVIVAVRANGRVPCPGRK